LGHSFKISKFEIQIANAAGGPPHCPAMIAAMAN
jgi:hypothetical protein